MMAASHASALAAQLASTAHDDCALSLLCQISALQAQAADANDADSPQLCVPVSLQRAIRNGLTIALSSPELRPQGCCWFCAEEVPSSLNTCQRCWFSLTSFAAKASIAQRKNKKRHRLKKANSPPAAEDVVLRVSRPCTPPERKALSLSSEKLLTPEPARAVAFSSHKHARIEQHPALDDHDDAPMIATFRALGDGSLICDALQDDEAALMVTDTAWLSERTTSPPSWISSPCDFEPVELQLEEPLGLGPLEDELSL